MNKMTNIAYVQLSDGRKVRVEAEHEGKVKVTLIYDDPPPEGVSPLYWAALSMQYMPTKLWEQDVLDQAEARALRGEGRQCPHGKYWYRETESESPEHPVGSLSIDCTPCSNTSKYTAVNVEGPDTAAVGRWKVEGPNVSLFYKDRVTAKNVARALNAAWSAAQED